MRKKLLIVYISLCSISFICSAQDDNLLEPDSGEFTEFDLPQMEQEDLSFSSEEIPPEDVEWNYPEDDVVEDY